MKHFVVFGTMLQLKVRFVVNSNNPIRLDYVL